MKHFMTSGRKAWKRNSPKKDYDLSVENSWENFVADLVTFWIMVDIIRVLEHISCTCCWKHALHSWKVVVRFNQGLNLREFNVLWCWFAVPWRWHQWSPGNVCLAKRERPTDYGRDGAWGRANSRASQTWWHEWQVSITCLVFLF